MSGERVDAWIPLELVVSTNAPTKDLITLISLLKKEIRDLREYAGAVNRELWRLQEGSSDSLQYAFTESKEQKHCEQQNGEHNGGTHKNIPYSTEKDTEPKNEANSLNSVGLIRRDLPVSYGNKVKSPNLKGTTTVENYRTPAWALDMKLVFPLFIAYEYRLNELEAYTETQKKEIQSLFSRVSEVVKDNNELHKLISGFCFETKTFDSNLANNFLNQQSILHTRTPLETDLLNEALGLSARQNEGFRQQNQILKNHVLEVEASLLCLREHTKLYKRQLCASHNVQRETLHHMAAMNSKILQMKSVIYSYRSVQSNSNTIQKKIEKLQQLMVSKFNRYKVMFDNLSKEKNKNTVTITSQVCEDLQTVSKMKHSTRSPCSNKETRDYSEPSGTGMTGMPTNISKLYCSAFSQTKSGKPVGVQTVENLESKETGANSNNAFSKQNLKSKETGSSANAPCLHLKVQNSRAKSATNSDKSIDTVVNAGWLHSPYRKQSDEFKEKIKSNGCKINGKSCKNNLIQLYASKIDHLKIKKSKLVSCVNKLRLKLQKLEVFLQNNMQLSQKEKDESNAATEKLIIEKSIHNFEKSQILEAYGCKIAHLQKKQRNYKSKIRKKGHKVKRLKKKLNSYRFRMKHHKAGIAIVACSTIHKKRKKDFSFKHLGKRNTAVKCVSTSPFQCKKLILCSNLSRKRSQIIAELLKKDAKIRKLKRNNRMLQSQLINIFWQQKIKRSFKQCTRHYGSEHEQQ